MTDSATGVKHAIATNWRDLGWKYWVFLAVWEMAAVSIATAGVVGGSLRVDGPFVFWTVVFTVFPALPLLIPLPAQLAIGHVVGLVFNVLIGAVMLWWVGAYAAVWLTPESPWAYKWRYALEKDMAGPITVEVSPRPHDCEFLTAPMGSKHCHYRKSVTTIRVRATGGRQMVSLDDGRTWVPGDGSARPAVFVTWERVED